MAVNIWGEGVKPKWHLGEAHLCKRRGLPGTDGEGSGKSTLSQVSHLAPWLLFKKHEVTKRLLTYLQPLQPAYQAGGISKRSLADRSR